MRILKLKLIFGIILVILASMIPAEFFSDLLRGSVDTSLGGFDFSKMFIQICVIFVGMIGMTMIKDVFLRSRNKTNRRKY